MEGLHFLVDLFTVGIEIGPYFFTVDDEEEGEENEEEEDCGKAMRPNVYAFVVDHKQALQYLGWSVEINSISVSNAAVIDHELWSFLQMTNEMRLVTCFFGLFLRCLGAPWLFWLFARVLRHLVDLT